MNLFECQKYLPYTVESKKNLPYRRLMHKPWDTELVTLLIFSFFFANKCYLSRQLAKSNVQIECLTIKEEEESNFVVPV